MDEDERSDNKQSKRDRFKGALARTKTKFKKEKENDKPKDTELPADVNDFLAAGRTSTSSWTQPKDSLPQRPTVSSLDEQSTSPASTRPSTSESLAQPFAASRSPRKIPVPKIDVSNAQRWPRANPVGTAEQEVNDFLRPEYQGRSQSANSFSNKPKKKGRGRGLSVSFIEAPPVIIGEGGDDAPTPPLEIGKARQRARSASPMPRRTQPEPAAPTNGTYGKRPSPVPPTRQAYPPPDVLQPRMLQRVQTGFSAHSPNASGLDREFEMTLGIGSNGHSPISTIGSTPNTPDIVSPKPIRIVQPPPAVFEEPDEHHTIKKQEPSTDLQQAFREGDALRMHLEKEAPDTTEEFVGWRPRRDINPGNQEPSKWP